MKRSLAYIANARIPTEKAHGLAIMRMCEALSKEGLAVELMVPRRLNPVKEEPFSYYGVEKNFQITRVPTLDLIFLGKFGYYLELLTYSLGVALICLFKKKDCYYGRDELPLTLVSLFRRGVVWEVHLGRKKFIHGLLKRCEQVVAISGGLKKYYQARGVSADKIAVVPSSVNLEEFMVSGSEESARRALTLPPDKKIVMYIGLFEDWKGYQTLLHASKLLDESYQVVLVGGGEKQVAELKPKYPQVIFPGFKPYRELALNQKAADLLVIPNSSFSETSKFFTSPLKLFAHMASGKPILASDLPSMREILDESNAFFFTPDDPASLAENIKNVFAQPEEARQRAERALEKVRDFTWEKRAKLIITKL